MARRCVSALAGCVLALLCWGAWGDESAAPAAQELVQRITPEYASRVLFRCEPSLQAATLRAEGEQLLISAGSVRECIRAYGYYLRHVAGAHFSWNGDCTAAAAFVLPQEPITVPPALPMNFAYNYCTLSYTAVHWDEARWMRELDMLALNGFRYVMVTPGLEKVWQGFLRDIGCPEKKISAFIAHPAYAAWWHMGNLEGEGGPVSPALIEREARLGRSIVRRACALGLEPVLQGYVGLLPHNFAKFKSNTLPQGLWCGYTRPSVLNPVSPAFAEVAPLWYKRLQAVYGYRATAFAGDLFHEGGRAAGIDLSQAAAAVQRAMQAASPGSLWFLQAWGHNPLPALLAGTSVEHTVILALHKDLSPGATIRRSYGGRRYIWCELANFGGNHGLYGGLDLLENMEGDAEGAAGLGLLSEGLETNPLYYELFFERLNHRRRIDRTAFLIRYAKARYNSDDPHLVQALSLLASGVYTPEGRREGCLENIMCARPGLDVTKASTWSNPNPYYSPEAVLQAGRLMLAAAKHAPQLLQLSTFRYDLADVCRQALADKARALLPRCKAAFESEDRAGFERATQAYCALISQMADLLATHEDFLLGRFLQGVSARAGAADAAQARRAVMQLITTWRPDTGLLNDYAHRQFSELMRCYYLPRWQAYFRTLEFGQSAALHSESNENNGTQVTAAWQPNAAVDAIERSIPTADLPLLTEPQGDLISLAEQALH